jgi:hypothetical protein
MMMTQVVLQNRIVLNILTTTHSIWLLRLEYNCCWLQSPKDIPPPTGTPLNHPWPGIPQNPIDREQGQETPDPGPMPHTRKQSMADLNFPFL